MGYFEVENELYEKWDEILENMRVNFDISDPAFNTFIKILKVHSISGKNLTILIDDAKEIGRASCRESVFGYV